MTMQPEHGDESSLGVGMQGKLSRAPCTNRKPAVRGARWYNSEKSRYAKRDPRQTDDDGWRLRNGAGRHTDETLNPAQGHDGVAATQRNWQQPARSP